MYLKCTAWWFHISIHHKRIPTTKLISTSILQIVPFLWVCCIGWEHKFYSLSKNQIYATVLSTIATILYSICSDLIHFITENLSPFTTSPHCSHPPAPGNHHWTRLDFWKVLLSMYRGTMQYLSFSILLILLSILPSNFIHVANDRISNF